jgi:hypothetical protein
MTLLEIVYEQVSWANRLIFFVEKSAIVRSIVSSPFWSSSSAELAILDLAFIYSSNGTVGEVQVSKDDSVIIYEGANIISYFSMKIL